MTRPPEVDDTLEAMAEMFNGVSAHREALTTSAKASDELKAALDKALPELRNTLLDQAERIEVQQELIADQAALIAKLVEYVNLLHERKEAPRSPLGPPSS